MAGADGPSVYGRNTTAGSPRLRSTCSATLPNSACIAPLRPCEQIATSVPGTRWASSTIAAAAPSAGIGTHSDFAPKGPASACT